LISNSYRFRRNLRTPANHQSERIMNRRDFLKQSAIVAAALSASALDLFASDQKEIERKGRTKRVLVVGAGLAGLSAAYELARVGHDITIIEAQTRPGGRVLTLREPFADGLHAEAGAARIPADHNLTLKYARLFNLPLDPMYPSTGSFVAYEKGNRSEINWRLYAAAVERVIGVILGPDTNLWFKIRGGNDLLPKAMASSFSEKIIYGSPVKRIEHDSSGVRAFFTDKGTPQMMTGDYLIFAVPFGALKRIEISPPLSSKKLKVVDETTYASITRAFIQTSHRPWIDKGLNGFGVTDDPMEVWQPAFNQPGRRGILMAYARGKYSERLTGMREGERVDHTVAQMEKLFSGTRASIESGITKCWDLDEWAHGAWAETNWGKLHKIFRPEGRIHFAGDHLSTASSWMQGALESGNRVAREVNDSR
jgi:monoamine oxidase